MWLTSSYPTEADITNVTSHATATRLRAHQFPAPPLGKLINVSAKEKHVQRNKIKHSNTMFHQLKELDSNVASLMQPTCGHECCKQGVVSKAKKKRPEVSYFLSS